MISNSQCFHNSTPQPSKPGELSSSYNRYELPHQKLIVIDGLLAFKGSANLTLTAWRKAQSGYNELEAVTNMENVINLHNRCFSAIWAKLSEYGNIIAIANRSIDEIVA